MEDSTSSKSDGDGSDQEDGIVGMGMAEREREPKLRQVEDDELGDGLKVTLSSDGSLDTNDSFNSHRHHPLNHQDAIGGIMGMAPNALSSAPVTIGASTDLLTPNAAATRRRRKLPEIPKNQKSPIRSGCRAWADVDSGHSTAHSPNDFKSMSPQITSPVSQSPFPPPFGGVPFGQLEMLEATHRGLHKFVPRHHDEIELEIGDAIYVQKEAEDLWCEGVNLRTGRQGIFPSAYAVDLDYNEFDPTVQLVKKERYLLGYLGSVETLAHKGTGVVCQAVRKIVGEYGASPTGQTCILEVSDQGLRMVDRSGPNNKKEKKPCIDYFYSLKNVSFCAFHPRDHRFIGFITKHPTVQRFACHVFKGSESTRPVAEAVGRAFQRFYQKFIETAYPMEDIYIE
ncbi:GL11746 [Drosophila persimilis]|uniref:GL11746 n=1 Tax=Drosophila persimilis TaxID=7234 RepID=B4IQY3_DROPE|nr:GL11746 [Drosophila persimilis]